MTFANCHQPPVGGLGANAGAQDSADLFIKLKEASEKCSRRELVKEYEVKMLERAQPIVQLSSGGAGRFFMMKPLSELRPAVLWQ
jgi:2-polyprenyl-6-methoxyphenol hydroxylase-like FAD-dependent oxidoreductase